MANYRYTYDYNGRRYEIDAPKGSTASDLQRIVQGSSRGNPPAPTRQTKQAAVQQQMLKKSEEDQGFLDRIFAGKPKAPKALTETEQSSRVKDIAAERKELLTLAASLESQAKPTRVSFDPRAPDRAQALRERAKSVRAQAAALGKQAAFIEKTGVETPKPSRVRAALTGAPREFTRGITSLPGVLEEFTGRGLSMVGASDTGKYLTKTGQADQEAARKLSEDIFGAPEDALQYDSTAQLISDVSSGAGSMATFAVPGGAARLAGVGKGLQGAEKAAAIAKAARAGQYGIATTQGAGQGAEDIRAYEQRTGKKVSDATAFVTMLLNAGLGAAEVGVFNKLVERIPVAQRGAAMEKVAETVRRLSGGRVDPTAIATAVGRELTAIEANAAGRIAVRGGAEAAQEGGVQAGSNLIAQQLYDKDRDVMEGVGYSALVGGIVGGTVRGGIELKDVLGGRAAENRKKYFEQTMAASEPLEEFDVNVGSYEDPSQLTRQKIQRISEPDENGDVLARRADGTVYQTSLKELYRMRAPTEGIRAVPIPDTLSAPALTQRLVGALGNVEPDSDMQSYINSVTTTLNNNMALGTPEKTETYLQKQQNGLRRARLSEDAKIARMLVLDEAVKLNNEYVGLVTAPPEGTDPTVDQAVINEPPAPLSDEAIQSQIDSMRAMREQRAEALNTIASDPNYLDKVETFEALMVQNGFDAPSTVEVAALYDAMRAESDAETAAGEEVGASKRQRLVDRANIIERVLYDDRISSEEKADRINAKMKAKSLGPLSRYELERIAGVEAANAVFGPEGEYTQRRQALFDQVVADPTITDKYRGYAEALDQFPELGDPTVDEIRMLRGDAAPLEAQIAQSSEPITTAQLPAEPGGLTAEFKDVVAAREAIDAQIAVEQANLNAAPHMGAPAARRAINNIKALEAERAALGEAPAVEEAALDQPLDISYTREGLIGSAIEGLTPLAEGSESTVFRDGDKVVKVGEPYNDKADETFDARVNNAKEIDSLLGDGSLEYIGHYESANGAKNPVLTQNYVEGNPATQEEIDAHMESRGFAKNPDGRSYSKIEDGIEYTASDLDGDNVLVDADGNTHVIDASLSKREAPATKTPVPEELPPLPPTAPVVEEAPVTEQPASTATKQTINNPEEDVSPAEEQLEADPTTVEGAFPASLNRPRAEAIGFAADLERRVKSMSSRFLRKANNKYQNAADYSQALAASYGLTQLPPNLNVARKFELLESRKIGGQMQLNRWHLQPIEDKMKALGLDPKDVGMYLWARSARARNALVDERNGEQNGSGMSDAQAQAKLDQFEIEGLGPKLREIAKLHDALVDYIGNQRVKAGLLSKADWRAMRKAQPFYTPLKGYALDGDMQVDGEPNPHSDEERGIAESKGTRVREVLTARGRESMPFNPLFNLMSDAQFAIARIEQNKVKEAFLNNILSDPKSHEGLATVYTPKKETHTGGHVTMPKIGPSGPVNMNQIAAQKNSKLMIVKKDGKPYFIEFAETPAGNALYRAFSNMTPQALNKFMRGTTAVSNTIKSFKTRYNPVYLGSTAWMRDFNEAILTAYTAQGIKGGPAAGTKLGKRTARYIASLSGMNAISDYLKGKDPTTAEGEVLTLLFDQFLEDGGAVGHAQIMDAERYAQDTAKSIERYAAVKRGDPKAAALMAKDMTANALDTASQLIDLQARFATYRAALEEGISREDAGALALDSSLNLTRRGELAPYLDTLTFFYSPTAEGLRKLVSQGRYSTIARKLFTKVVVGGALLYLFNRFGPGAGDDDEDGIPNILEVGNVTAQTRIILRYGSGVNEYVAVPVAFGMGYFNYVGGQVMATVLGDISPVEAGVNIVGGFTDMASPIKTEGTEGLTSLFNFITPDPIIQPFMDLIRNRSAFGSSIYTEKGYSTTPKSELGREDTGEGWKFIARGMNSLTGGNSTVEGWGSMQPEQYRYIVSQLLGGAYGVGRDTVALVTDEAKPGQMLVDRLPIIKTFFGKGGEYAPMNKFYTDYDELRAIHSTYTKSDAEPEAWAENQAMFPVQADTRVMDAFDTALSEIHSINDNARDGGYDKPQDKYDALNDVYKEFNQVYGEVKKAK
jgi:hypothetical protein